MSEHFLGIPGRLEDLISSGQLSLKQCRFFILDEADGLLKAGYQQLIDRMHAQIPKMTSDGSRLQVYFTTGGNLPSFLSKGIFCCEIDPYLTTGQDLPSFLGS